MAERIVEPRPIKRILIANRGEIATRILSACRELGLETFALYTDNDIAHTFHAAHALHLESAAAYTSIDGLAALVRAHEIDAVHPGYGFLSESAAFAARLAELDVLLIGPGAANLARTGDKLRARALAETACGVPCLPALTAPTARWEDVAGFARAHGLPIMVKAVDGGGGRGIRLVRQMQDLQALVTRAIEESPARSVFAEKAAVDGFRHVEVQIVGDGRGGVRHLWERECSIQRRYQKVVELAPSRCADRDLVAPVIAAAVRMAEHVRYASLGTFEFLLHPGTGEFFFLEINPRLQVEHTITESICGVDLVQAQLRLAQGATFADAGLGDLAQNPTTPPSQHSIQLRVAAEDPEKKYALSIGRIQSFRFPSGAGIRVDTALVPGTPPALVSADFDSVVAKIIVTARTWSDVVRKAQRALEDTSITGIATNLALLRAIVSHPDFAAGACDTQWLESKHEELLTLSRELQTHRSDPFHGLVQSASHGTSASTGGAGAGVGGGGSGGNTVFRKDDAWTIDLRPQESQSNSNNKTNKHPNNTANVRQGEAKPPQSHLQLTKILQNDFPASLAAEILFTSPHQAPQPFTIQLRSTSASAAATTGAAHRPGNRADPSHVILPLSGKLMEVLVEVGDEIGPDEPVCVVKQMKMEVEVRSHRAGVVSWVTEVEEGEDVAEGMLAAVVAEVAEVVEGRSQQAKL